MQKERVRSLKLRILWAYACCQILFGKLQRRSRSGANGLIKVCNNFALFCNTFIWLNSRDTALGSLTIRQQVFREQMQSMLCCEMDGSCVHQQTIKFLSTSNAQKLYLCYELYFVLCLGRYFVLQNVKISMCSACAMKYLKTFMFCNIVLQYSFAIQFCNIVLQYSFAIQYVKASVLC